MNFFTLDRSGNLSYANINDPRFARVAPGKNLWEEYPDMVGTPLYQACLSSLEDHHEKHVEYFEPGDQSWWENHIFPDKTGISIYTEDITEKKRLELAHANVTATLQNTEVRIWSLNRKLEFLFFNQSFASYMREAYGVDPAEGAHAAGRILKVSSPKRYARWLARCKRVLNGHTITFADSTTHDRALYVLSPIYENQHVMGISAFSLSLADADLTPRPQDNIPALKLKVLNAAMNFHFIFSTLNSIQHYILTNNKESALHYLTSFSRLIRGTLNSTLHAETTLANELELLKHYIKLEQIRFEEPFDFRLHMEPGVNTTTRIPALILQPYIENAIVHGLINKEGHKQLDLHVSQADGQIIIRIDDNGIGRTAANLLRQQKKLSYNAASMHITEKRLELIKHYTAVSVTIHDKKENNLAGGTQVTIRFKTT